MNIIVAEHSGFCFGVKKAVSIASETKAGHGRIFTYGPIIHNNIVVKELEQKGINVLPNIDELNEGDTVIIRSHGVSKKIIDMLNEKKVNIVDATCPYVDHIHKKVEEYFNNGYQIIIIGDKDHPEVQGINGWCDNSAIIISNLECVKDLKTYNKVCIVSQTTVNTAKWREIVSSLIGISKELVILNTICAAADQRQKSAAEIAQKCDAMIVLGGLNSSNTKKLAEICRQFCPKTFYIERINQLDTNNLKNINTLGITAGASTPDWIIKEAFEKMSEMIETGEEKVQGETEVKENNKSEDKDIGEDKDIENEEKTDQGSIMSEYEKTFKRLSEGDIIKGKVIYVTDDEVTVDIGYKADGIIPKSELNIDEETSPKDILKSGDELDVYILKINDGEGNVLLSKRRVDAVKNMDYIGECFKGKVPVEGEIIQTVKGGVIAKVKGNSVFIPASQLDVKYVKDLSIFVGKTERLLIMTFEPAKNRIVASRRAIVEDELNKKRSAFLESIKPGDILKGRVDRLADFGAFIDLGCIDGLAHISELSWTRVKSPSDVVKVGDIVEVYVLSVDKEKERISLSLKRTLPQPWDIVKEKVHVGDVIEGKVVRIVPFGAFVEIQDGVDGLVHISQICDRRINRVEDVLKVNDIVKVKVMDINLESRKISLSIKEASEEENKGEQDEEAKTQNPEPAQIQTEKPEKDNLTIGEIVQNNANK